MKAIIHAKAVLPGRVLENATILLDGERIAAVGRDLTVPAGAEVLDAAGRWVGPGFVDIHLHGGGYDSWLNDPEAVAAYHLRHGSTTLVAYLGYDLSPADLLAATKRIQAAIDEGKLPNVTAIGYEGPYINPHQGANSAAGGRSSPDEAEYTALYEACHGHVAQWMYAPELDRDGRFGTFLREHGVVAAVGHTEATPAQVRRAVDLGASVTTHLFDAMGCAYGNDSVDVTGIIQDTAAVGCLICPELTYEIIPDSLGVHVKPGNMCLAYRLAGPRRIAIITDSTVCAYDPADYPKDHIRSTPDLNFNDAAELSGSRLTMDQAFRNFGRHTGVPVPELFEMAATTPARAIRIDHLTGSLVPGKYADLVVLNEALEVETVLLRGETVK